MLQLESLQQLRLSFSSEARSRMQQGVLKLKRLLAVDEAHFMQLAKDKWCSSMDRNIRYFHAVLANSRRRTFISSKPAEQGVRMASHDPISTEIMQY